MCFHLRLGVVLLGVLAMNAMAIEEAAYAVELSEADFELRSYEPQIVAEVIIDDEFKDAGNRAFRPLFRYITGANTSREDIAMTAPVSQEKRGEKIAMTTPVGQRAEADGWAVSFMMPAEFTMDTIPEPTDPTVTLREIPPHRMAVVRYSGRWTESNFDQHLAELESWITDRGLEVIGEPVWARYNGPFTPWFMRRNEILLPIGP